MLFRRERQNLGPRNDTGADNKKCTLKLGDGKGRVLIFNVVPLIISAVTKCREGNSSSTEQSLQTRLTHSNIMLLSFLTC